MKILRWFVDCWLRFSIWWQTRRDTIARLQAEIDRRERLHQEQVEGYQGQIRIRDEHIAALTEAHQRFRSILQADMAVNNRVIADATIPRVPT